MDEAQRRQALRYAFQRRTGQVLVRANMRHDVVARGVQVLHVGGVEEIDPPGFFSDNLRRPDLGNARPTIIPGKVTT